VSCSTCSVRGTYLRIASLCRFVSKVKHLDGTKDCGLGNQFRVPVSEPCGCVGLSYRQEIVRSLAAVVHSFEVRGFDSMAFYLVTGAAGFIGCSLARALVSAGQQVRGLDNLSTGKLENIADMANPIDFRNADLLDLAAVEDACKGVDYVLHQAAIASVPRSVEAPIATNEANVTGTLNVLVAARDAGVKRVVYASSSSVYGEDPILPKHEGMLPDPISPYAVSKLAGEMYMKSFYRVYGLETVCLRYFNVFGPRQDASSHYSGVLAKFIMTMLRGERPVIFGDGEQTRDFNFIDNTVQANLLACAAPSSEVAGRVFNIATGTRVTLNGTYHILQGLTGYNGNPSYESARCGDIRHSQADISLARAGLGYIPEVDFSEGLRRTVDWYRAQNAAAAESNSSRATTS
jgi:nucleoside-diphosphate-sugar epimerase